MSDRQKILIFSKTPVPEIVASSKWPHYENKSYDQVTLTSDSDLPAILAREKPHVIVSTGQERDWPTLYYAEYDTRKKWLHFPQITAANVEDVGEKVGIRFVIDALESDANRQFKKVSAFTCTYRTPDEHLERLYSGLRSQTWTNWEWVIYDDSDDNDVTFSKLRALARADHRIAVYRGSDRTGVIGHNKRAAAMLCHGDILAEIDHDDAITKDCFELLVLAYHKYPQCGFFYSNCYQSYEDGEPIVYGESVQYDFGKYRNEYYEGKEFRVLNTAPVNAKTVRNLACAPNHIRAWRKDVYHQIGGHNPKLYVVDDFEIVVRTFLATRFVHIPRFCYFQYYRRDTTSNTQRIRALEIQRLNRLVSFAYDHAIHARILALGFDDWIWTGKHSATSIPTPADISSVPKFNETLEIPVKSEEGVVSS